MTAPSGAPDPAAPDPEPAAADPEPEAAPAGSPPPRRSSPPGVKEQAGRTKDAFRRLLDAHVDLAKAEASEIGGQVARAAGLVGCAIAILTLVGLLFAIGFSLFLAEWLLGSMGWGILHGLTLFPAIAIAAILLAIGFSGERIAGWFGLSLLIGIVISVVLGLHLLNQLYAALGDQLLAGVDPAWRTILMGAIVGAIVIAVISILPAASVGGGGAVGVILLGAIIGALVGAFTAITFDWGPAVGVGLTVAWLSWIALMGADVARTGIDTEALKQRFYPSTTIDTGKETLEWLKQRMPRGPES